MPWKRCKVTSVPLLSHFLSGRHAYPRHGDGGLVREVEEEAHAREEVEDESCALTLCFVGRVEFAVGSLCSCESTFGVIPPVFYLFCTPVFFVPA